MCDYEASVNSAISNFNLIHSEIISKGTIVCTNSQDETKILMEKNELSFLCKYTDKYFIGFKSFRSFIKFYEAQDDKKNYYYELLIDKKPCKIFCDIDGEPERLIDDATKEFIISTFIKLLKDNFKQCLGEEYDHKKAKWLESSRPEKFSLHFIYDSEYCVDAKTQGEFWKYLAQKIQDMEEYKWLRNKLWPEVKKGGPVLIDLAVYSANRAFRIMYSKKCDFGCDKMAVPLKPKRVSEDGKEVKTIKFDEENPIEFYKQYFVMPHWSAYPVAKMKITIPQAPKKLEEKKIEPKKEVPKAQKKEIQSEDVTEFETDHNIPPEVNDEFIQGIVDDLEGISGKWEYGESKRTIKLRTKKGGRKCLVSPDEKHESNNANLHIGNSSVIFFCLAPFCADKKTESGGKLGHILHKFKKPEPKPIEDDKIKGEIDISDKKFYFNNFIKKYASESFNSKEDIRNKLIPDLNRVFAIIDENPARYVQKSSPDKPYQISGSSGFNISFEISVQEQDGRSKDAAKKKTVSLSFSNILTKFRKNIRSYVGICCCMEGKKEGYFNTWRGFKAKVLDDETYDEKKASAFKEIVNNAVCGRNDRFIHIFMTALYICFFKLREKTGVLIYLFGPPGTGKSTLLQYICIQLFGLDVSKIIEDGLNFFEQNFNSLASYQRFMALNETRSGFKGDIAKMMNILKALVTDFLRVDKEKYRHDELQENITNYMVGGNHMIPIEENDRRIIVIPSSTSYKEDFLKLSKDEKKNHPFVIIDEHLRDFEGNDMNDHVLTYIKKWGESNELANLKDPQYMWTSPKRDFILNGMNSAAEFVREIFIRSDRVGVNIPTKEMRFDEWKEEVTVSKKDSAMGWQLLFSLLSHSNKELKDPAGKYSYIETAKLWTVYREWATEGGKNLLKNNKFHEEIQKKMKIRQIEDVDYYEMFNIKDYIYEVDVDEIL